MHEVPTRASTENYSMIIISLAFHLFVETTSTEARTNKNFDPIELAGVTALEVRDGRLTTSPGAPRGAVVLEAVFLHNEPLLAMTVGKNGPAVRVNGLVAGPVRVLRIADVIEFPDGGPVLHVTLLERPYCGGALPDHVGRECPICLAPIGPNDRVLVCAHCQTVMHELAESSAKPGESLECARMSSNCPVCSRTLSREEGYAYVPEI
jgi:hypothetical protein